MVKNAPREKLIEESIEYLHILGRHVGPGREQALCHADINRAQMKFLYILYTEKALTIPELREKTNTTPGAITQIVKGLEVKGFVMREKSEKDRRHVTVKFSPEGKKKFERIKKLHIAFLKGLFGTLTDRELSTMVSIGKKLISNFHVLNNGSNQKTNDNKVARTLSHEHGTRHNHH